MDSRILPETFADAYERLWDRAYSDGGVDGVNGHPLNGNAGILGKADGKPTGQWPVKSSEVTSVGARSTGAGIGLKAVGKTSRTMKDERAFRLKVRVDKRLRKLAREIMASLEGRSIAAATVRVCTGKCKKFGDVEWLYCARCGGPMRDVEENESQSYHSGRRAGTEGLKGLKKR